MVLSKAGLREIVGRITYKRGWRITILAKGRDFLLQVTFFAADADRADGLEHLQKGRKWYLSRFACESEVVATAFKAITAAEEHEAREFFRYGGEPIFNPHISPSQQRDVLASGTVGYDVRETPARAAAAGKL